MEIISWTLVVYLLTPTMMQTVRTEKYSSLEVCMAAGDKIIHTNKEKANSYMTTCTAEYQPEKATDDTENGK